MPANVTWSVSPHQVVFLTYAQAGRINASDIQAHLDTLGSDHHVVGHEHHVDGGDHYHCIAHFGSAQKWRNARVFDVGDLHPNVELGKKRGSVGRILAYCTKDGDFFEACDECRSFFDSLSDEAGKTSRNEIWAEIIAEPTQSGFLDTVRRLAPYEYATRYTALLDYCAAHYSTEPYVAPDVTWAPTVAMTEMTSWVDEFLVRV